MDEINEDVMQRYACSTELPVDEQLWPYEVMFEFQPNVIQLSDDGSKWIDTHTGPMFEWLDLSYRQSGESYDFIHTSGKMVTVPEPARESSIENIFLPPPRYVFRSGHYFYFKDPVVASLFKLTFG